MVGRAAAEPQGRPNKYTDVGVVGRYPCSDGCVIDNIEKQD